MRLITALWKSFYSPSLYQDVRQNWGYNTLFYLLLLVVVYTASLFISNYKTLSEFITTQGQALVNQVPTGKIIQGKMTINKASPYTIYFTDPDKKQPEPLVLFDMTNQTQTKDSPASIIFHSNGYYFYQTSHQPLTKTLKENQRSKQKLETASYNFQTYPLHQNLYFSAQQAQQLLDKIKTYFPLVIILFLAFVKFVFKLIQAIVYAFLVLIFGACCKVHLSYSEAYKLALVAVTPSFILTCILSVFLSVPHPLLIGFILELVYLFFAAYSNRPKRAL